jgi:membrane protein
VAIRLTAAVAGRGRVESLATSLGLALPATQAPAPVIQAFVQKASTVPWPTAAIAVLPATVWGEGLRRGLSRLTPLTPAHDGRTPTPPPGRTQGWRSRLAVVPLLLLSPAGLLAILGTAPYLVHLFGTEGPGTGLTGSAGLTGAILAFYLALNLDWILVSLVLVYVYRALSPRPPRWPALVAGSFFTGAFISGFLQGFVIFLAVPVDLGAPFGGFTAAGATIALALWAWLFTTLSILGYTITQALDIPEPAGPERDAPERDDPSTHSTDPD